MMNSVFNIKKYNYIVIWMVFFITVMLIINISAQAVKAENTENIGNVKNAESAEKAEYAESVGRAENIESAENIGNAEDRVTENVEIIREVKESEFTKYANTGASKDNMKSFCYGWMIHSKDKTERSKYTQVVDGCIVFEAQRDEFLPGGYIFTTLDEESGLMYGLSDLEPGQKVKIAYIVNIDPLSKDYTGRLMNFEIKGVGRETIGLYDGTPNAWGDPNDLIIPHEYLGKDLRIVFKTPLKADENGDISMNLINYSAAHYPLFLDEQVNINRDGFNAPFKVVFKALQFLTEESPEGIQVIEEGYEPLNIQDAPEQEFSSNLVRAAEAEIYSDSEKVSQGLNNNQIIYIILGVIGAVLVSGGIYFMIQRKSEKSEKSVKSVKSRKSVKSGKINNR